MASPISAIARHTARHMLGEGRPIKDQRAFTAEHRDPFKVDPACYAPQYRGYCAYGVAQGYTVDIDPEAFCAIRGHVATAGRNWPELAR